MDNGFGEKLNAVLSDPEAMEKITRIASGLSSNGENADRTAGMPQLRTESVPQSKQLSGKAAFISSLRPMLREDKRKKLDSLQTALMVAEMFGKNQKRETGLR